MCAWITESISYSKWVDLHENQIIMKCGGNIEKIHSAHMWPNSKRHYCVNLWICVDWIGKLSQTLNKHARGIFSTQSNINDEFLFPGIVAKIV